MAAGLAIEAPSAEAIQTAVAQPHLVGVVPGTNTPDVRDGVVFAIAKVGTEVFLGGSFTKVSPHGSSTTYLVNHAVAFDAATGTIDTTGFRPSVNGEVDAVIPGPVANSVYIGGRFSTVDGKNMHVALLDTRTGALVAGWRNPVLNGVVNDLTLAGGRLYVAGNFTTAGGVAHGGLVSLDPSTGSVTDYVMGAFTGHHNYGVNCDPTKSTCAKGAVGVRKIDVDPSATHLIAIGNFNTAGGLPRDQVALLDLGGQTGRVDPNWNTLAYSAKCFANAFDVYVRGVQFAPDGSYFVIASTGGSGSNRDGTNSSCDTAARFDTAATGSNVRPRWIDYSGQDTLISIAITTSVVYVGGHERWMNNSTGHDNAGEGAVPRPGIVALDPTNGIPFTWNPGRNPRGAGAYALLATSDGLYVGSDTDYIGNHTYLRRKIAYFPLTGGETLPHNLTGALPGKLYSAGGLTSQTADQFVYRSFDGTTAGVDHAVSTGISWGTTRGAFMVDGVLYYGKTDGKFYERTFDGSTFGPETRIDPYHDPYWDPVGTGSGQTYTGTFPNYYGSTLGAVTSSFYTNGRLYYTQSGARAMKWRWFTPESGIIGSDTFLVDDGQDWSNTAGAFLAGGNLYFAKTTGALYKSPWVDGRVTSAGTVVDSTRNWASRDLFLLVAAAETADGGSPNADKAPPVPTMRALPAVSTRGVITIRWSAVDTNSGVRNFDVRYRVARWNSTFARPVYPRTWTRTTSRSGTKHLSPGHEYCFAVRARDNAGNLSAWSPETCVTAPIDDRTLQTRDAWNRTVSSHYFRHTATVTKRRGYALHLAGAKARRIGIVATTCPHCGKVAVYVNGTRVRTINLRSTTRKFRHVVLLPVTRLRTVSIRLETRSASLAAIDGLVAIRRQSPIG